MKKALLTLACITLLLGLCGCQAVDPDAAIPNDTTTQQTEKTTEPQTDVQTEPQTEPESIPSTELQPELDHSQVYRSVDSLLESLWQEQNVQGGNTNVNGTNNSVSTVVPILKKADYEFKYVQIIPENRIEYAFDPIGSKKNDYSGRLFFRVYFSPLFEIKKELGFGIGEYKVIHDNTNWIFKVGDFSVAVRFPADIEHNLKTQDDFYEKVTEYFSDYEIVTYSPTAETNAVP